MGVFDDVKLGWKDRTHVIPAGQVLGAIARIEDVITFYELIEYGKRNTAPLGKVAQAYGSVLRFAGADVTDDEVYETLMSDGGSQTDVVNAVTGLLSMMSPVSARDASKVNKPGNSRKGVSRPSRRSSKSSSAMAG